MEAFGLFQLLNSMLSPAPKEGDDKAPSSSPDLAAPTPVQSPPTASEPPNACASFFAMHESRAKRNRK